MAETRKRVRFATKRRKGRTRVWKYRWVIKKGGKKAAPGASKAGAPAPKPAPAAPVAPKA